MSCWCVWFFRRMYWMYSVALSRIWARDACCNSEKRQRQDKDLARVCGGGRNRQGFICPVPPTAQQKGFCRSSAVLMSLGKPKPNSRLLRGPNRGPLRRGSALLATGGLISGPH